MRPHPDTELGVDFLFTYHEHNNWYFKYHCKEPKTRKQDLKPECTNNRKFRDGLIIQNKLSTFALRSIHLSRNMQPFVGANQRILRNCVKLFDILKLRCKTLFLYKLNSGKNGPVLLSKAT